MYSTIVNTPNLTVMVRLLRPYRGTRQMSFINSFPIITESPIFAKGRLIGLLFLHN